MARALRRLLLVLAILIVAGIGGFVHFATSIELTEPFPTTKADGIVILTGGDDRIAAGLALMQQGYGRRLLISGVNRNNRTIQSLVGPSMRSAWLMRNTRCCVDLGYQAQNTTGNAREARDWANKWGFRRIIVVTSDFHMPRSLTEFQVALPNVEVIAHPVASHYGRVKSWWHHRSTALLLANEFAKFLIVKARVGIGRVVGSWGYKVAGTASGGPEPI